jgi:c(7)-type cytochrome triheme protein
MQKLFVIVTAVLASLFLTASVFAVPPGQTVEFTPQGVGKVVFNGATHAQKGLTCADCHPGLFPMKKGGLTLTMKDMEAGKGCGACHNGTKAFSVKEAANCGMCHK